MTHSDTCKTKGGLLLSWFLIYDMFIAAFLSKVVLRKPTHFISITWPFWLVLSYLFLLGV